MGKTKTADFAIVTYFSDWNASKWLLVLIYSIFNKKKVAYLKCTG